MHTYEVGSRVKWHIKGVAGLNLGYRHARVVHIENQWLILRVEDICDKEGHGHICPFTTRGFWEVEPAEPANR